MSPITFTFNVAFSVNVNENLTIDHPDYLAAWELWEGIKRGGRNPNDFAPYVAKCDVLEGGSHEFVRRLTLADGAVHTASGKTLDQIVVIAEGLQVEATTIETGAKSTWIMSRDVSSVSSLLPSSSSPTATNTTITSDESNEKQNTQAENLTLTASYELKLSDVEPGSEHAIQIETDYTALARKACRDGAESIRTWKREGKLKVWKDEHDRERGRERERLLNGSETINGGDVNIAADTGVEEKSHAKLEVGGVNGPVGVEV